MRSSLVFYRLSCSPSPPIKENQRTIKLRLFGASGSTSDHLRAVRQQQLHFSIFWEFGIWNRNKQAETAGSWFSRLEELVCVCVLDSCA